MMKQKMKKRKCGALLLACDVGTTGAKTVLIDSYGAVIAATAASYPTLHPRPD